MSNQPKKNRSKTCLGLSRPPNGAVDCPPRLRHGELAHLAQGGGGRWLRNVWASFQRPSDSTSSLLGNRGLRSPSAWARLTIRGKFVELVENTAGDIAIIVG